MVCGPSLTNAGIQPLKKEPTPSNLYICHIAATDESPRSLKDIIRVLTTSTGEQTVVATKPLLFQSVSCTYSEFTRLID